MHECDDCCGISYDPGCPLWDAPCFEYGSPQWLRTCSKQEKRGYHRDRRMAERIRLMGPLSLVALAERLADVLDTLREVRRAS